MKSGILLFSRRNHLGFRFASKWFIEEEGSKGAWRLWPEKAKEIRMCPLGRKTRVTPGGFVKVFGKRAWLTPKILLSPR